MSDSSDIIPDSAVGAAPQVQVQAAPAASASDDIIPQSAIGVQSTTAVPSAPSADILKQQPLMAHESIRMPDGSAYTGQPWQDAILRGMQGGPNDALSRQEALGARNAIEGVAGVVTAPLDIAGSVLNKLGDKNTFNFGQALRNKLTAAGYPQPTNAVERIAGAGQRLVAGATAAGGLAPTGESMVEPATEPATQPHPLAAAAQSETQRLADIKTRGEAAGLQLPEGGSTAQHAEAAVNNQPVANSVVRNELGLPDNAPLTIGPKGMLATGRKTYAGPAYQAIENIPSIPLGPKYQADIADIDLDQIAPKYRPPTDGDMSGEDAVDLSKELRARAIKYDKIASSGLPGSVEAGDLADTHRAAAEAVEDAVQDHLTSIGQPEAAQAWDDARVYTAKSYSAEHALSNGSGNVQVSDLKTQLFKNKKPLSDGLEDLATLGAQYPQAFKLTLPSAATPGFMRRAGAAVAPYVGGLIGGAGGTLAAGPAGAGVGAFTGSKVGESIAKKMLTP